MGEKKKSGLTITVSSEGWCALTGWNTSMSIRKMLDPLEGTYGKPNTMTLFTNDTLFHSPFNPVDAHEALFYRIEQCQEIQVLPRELYSDM
jgi:hypothetical protein